jgi:RNA polymerase sigma-70 factor (ECF subfamily)
MTPATSILTYSEIDNRRFSETVAPCVQHLLQIARRILKHDDLAWDAVQEALISLWKEEEPPVHARAWLKQAVVFRSLHLARTIGRRQRHEGRIRRFRSESSVRDEPSRQLVAEETQAILLQAVQDLSEAYRSVMELWLFDHLDYSAIAAILRVPVGTVRSRLNRAREELRRSLDPEILN